jgi:hypothetical protein
MALKRRFALKKMQARKAFAEEKTEPDAKAQLVGLLDPTKCDDEVINALAEACAIEVEQAKSLIEAIKQANQEGAEASVEFARGIKRDKRLHQIDANFSRKVSRILRNFAEEEEEDKSDKAVEGEVLSKDVAIIVKALDNQAFEAKSKEEIATMIEQATELPKDTALAILDLKESPVALEPVEESKELVQEADESDKKEAEAAEDEAAEDEAKSEVETFAARHKRLQKARLEFAKKQKLAKAKKTVKAKTIPQISLDMSEKIKDTFNKGKKEPKMKNISDNLEEIRAFSRKRHFAKLLRAKRLASRKFADPDAFEPMESPDPDKPQVASKGRRPHGHLNSTVAARIRSIRQSEATKARDTQGRIEDISAEKVGESLAEMNEMATCPNSRFSRGRTAKNYANSAEFATLRALLGDKYRE